MKYNLFMAKKVVVVLPTYNEKQNIEKFTNAVLAQEKNLPQGYSLEILIVDSKSPDGTGEIAKDLAKKNSKVHFLEVGRGLGVGLYEGHKYSLENLRPDVMAQLDADGQVEEDVLPKLVRAIDESYSLALGSRFVKGGQNKLSLSRRIFTYGSSLVCRVMMGPFNIREYTNSARAFTPALFRKINFDRIPWKEQTFIYMPAFVHEAVRAGAKYKEVPLIFRNRAEGYSKNKTVNYMYDMFTYVIDARLHSWGINIPFFVLTHKAKIVLKFGMVGLTGTIIDFCIYNFLIKKIGFPPATSKVFSTETAIVNNFLLNNFWTFKARTVSSNIFRRFGIFNLVSLGGLGIAVLVIKILHTLYGDGTAHIFGVGVQYYNLYFLVTIPPALVWNFTANNFITWRNKKK